jgi:hypothetical protein
MSPAARHNCEPSRPPLGDGGVCLGRTCLSWQSNGELSPTDVSLILERLCQVDEQACRVLSDAG